MEVQIISKENINPSSPTPDHLKTFKLSLLDQLIPAPYAPIVLFYPNYNCASNLEERERLQKLKKSLSDTLSHFYPLAGIIKDDLSIDCNDQGAYYVVSKVNCHLSEFLNQPDLKVMQLFLPCQTNFKGTTAGTQVTNIQVNVFKCGGIAIGVCISHKILDGAALGSFVKGWAAVTACDSDHVACPNFHSLFPANDLWLKDLSMAMWCSLFRKGKSKTRRFVFDASAVATLKTRATSSGTVRYTTTVEAVSAFIWRCAINSSQEKHGFRRPSLLTHVINLRRRTTPTLPDYLIGNLIWVSSAKCPAKQEIGYHGLVDKVRESLSRINGDFVKKLKGDEGYSVMCKSLKEIWDFGSKKGVDYFGFTSWCKLGFYDADFGWGKPLWVSSVGSCGGPVFMNLVILMETRSGDGIEAWMTLGEEEMNILESDLELLELASLDPSPLNSW